MSSLKRRFPSGYDHLQETNGPMFIWSLTPSPHQTDPTNRIMPKAYSFEGLGRWTGNERVAGADWWCVTGWANIPPHMGARVFRSVAMTYVFPATVP